MTASYINQEYLKADALYNNATSKSL